MKMRKYVDPPFLFSRQSERQVQTATATHPGTTDVNNSIQYTAGHLAA